MHQKDVVFVLLKISNVKLSTTVTLQKAAIKDQTFYCRKDIIPPAEKAVLTVMIKIITLPITV